MLSLFMEELERKIILLLADKKPRIQNQIADSVGLDHKLSKNRNRISRAVKKLENMQILKRLPSYNVLGKQYTINNAAFKKIAGEFLGYQDELEFLQSKYSQDWIAQNTAGEFEKNFSIDFEAIQDFFDAILKTPKMPPLEYLRGMITELVAFSPSALKFLLTTKVEDVEGIIRLLKPEEFFYNLPESLGFLYIGLSPHEIGPATFKSRAGWRMYLYCEYIIKILNNNVTNDAFKYTEHYSKFIGEKSGRDF